MGKRQFLTCGDQGKPVLVHHPSVVRRCVELQGYARCPSVSGSEDDGEGDQLHFGRKYAQVKSRLLSLTLLDVSISKVVLILYKKWIGSGGFRNYLWNVVVGVVYCLHNKQKIDWFLSVYFAFSTFIPVG